MIRFIDFLLALTGLIILAPIIVLLIVIGLFDTGSPLFIQVRMGRNKKPFRIVKLRTMHVDALSVATHLASASSVTKYGRFLRKSKLDELPQLLNVLLGQMSLVGPRPNLFNQEELIRERDFRRVYAVRPGITGLAQIQSIDMSTPELLAETDEKMILHLSVLTYFKYIFLTVSGRGSGDRVVSNKF